MAGRKQVAIVGAGPAGIFAGLALSDVPGVKVRIFEKGPDIDARLANARRKGKARDARWLLSGWGGAGAFSDGKLTLSPQVGGQLTSYLPRPEVDRLLAEVDGMWLRFGAPEAVYGGDEDGMSELAARATRADLKLVATRIRISGRLRDRSAGPGGLSVVRGGGGPAGVGAGG